ncbi:nuclease-related domain-containing protein [Salibacterium halotolerans]|nr:nuclease-related domain-containing protein [Salibacterium halotolerans]
MELPLKYRQQLMNIEKGLEGEIYFDSQLQALPDESVILCDLLFEINNTHFQIDTLLLSHDVVHLFEVKNYEGDFMIENEVWYTTTGYEIKNPLLQLQRNQSLLRQLFQKYRISLPVKASLVFTNPDFYVYQASYDLPIIFPHQIEPFVSQWKHDPVQFSHESHRAAEKLQALHIEMSPFRQFPAFTRRQLQNGIRCRACSAFLKLPQRTLICPACGRAESLEKGVIRNAEEWKLLFPEEPLTTRGVHEWCGLDIDKKRIKRILSKKYSRFGNGRRSHFQ